MGFFTPIKRYFDERAQSRHADDELRAQAEREERLLYEREYKKAAHKAAMIKAKRDAEEKTGLAKLRAISQANSSSGGFAGRLQAFKEYREKNIMRREQNLKRTAALRRASLDMRRDKVAKHHARVHAVTPGRPRHLTPLRGLRNENLQQRKPTITKSRI